LFRSLLSLVALAVLIAAPPLVAAPAQSKAAPHQTAAPASAPAPARVVNINTASAADLESLPSIGAKTAARIIEHRQKNGPFKKIEEVMNVRGVGEKSFLKLKPQLTVGAVKADRPQQ
jgi:competence protein ComEA